MNREQALNVLKPQGKGGTTMKKHFSNVTLATEIDELNKCFLILANAKREYPFIRYQTDDDLNAIRVWHKDYPEIVYAICWAKIKVEKEQYTILDEHIHEWIDGFKVEYWNAEDSDLDRIISKTKSYYAAATDAILEIILVDFENKDLF
jgi:hypothetical protein